MLGSSRGLGYKIFILVTRVRIPYRVHIFEPFGYIYNKMKKCPKCNLEKENLEFNKHSNTKDGLTSWCKVCVREYTKRKYTNDKESILLKQEQIRKEKKKWINEIKSTLKCEKCGENHIATLDFHHINPNEKEFQIAQSYFSKEKILEEMKTLDEESADILNSILELI